MARLWVLLRWLLLVLVLLLGLSAASLYWLTATNHGSKTLLQLAVKQSSHLGIELQLGRVAGNLRDGLLLEEIELRTAELDLSVQRLLLSVQLSQLLRKELIVQTLVIDRMDLYYQSPQQPIEQASAPFVLPLTVTVDELLLRNSQLSLDDTSVAIALASLRGRASPSPKQSIYQLTVDTLRGDLNGLAFEAGGSFLLDDQRLDFDGLNLTVADNRLAIQGNIDAEQLALDFDLDFSNLTQLLPDAQGQLRASGQLGGTKEQPALQLHASGQQLAFAEYQLKSLQLDATVLPDTAAAPNEQDTHDSIAVQLRAEAFAMPDLAISAVTLSIDGLLSDHAIALGVQASEFPVSALTLALQGGYDAQSWHGDILDLQLFTAALGQLTLAAPTPVRVAADAIALGELCLRNASAEGLCLDGELQEQRLAFNGRIEALGINSILAIAAPDWRASGTLNADFVLSGTTAQPNFVLTLAPVQGALDLSDQQLAISSLPFLIEEATIDWQHDQAALVLAIDLENYGRINAKITTLAEELSGAVQLRMDSIVWLERFAPLYARNIDGKLYLDAELAGRLDAPQIALSGTLENGRLQSPQAGIQVEAIQLALTPADDAVLLTGSALSGEGTLRLDGNLNLTNQTLRLRVQGDNVTAVRRPEAEVLVSPDLLYFQQGQTRRITGTVSIPRAQIRLRKPPEGAVSPSEDEKIVGVTQAAAEVTTPFDVDIELLLGEEVHLFAFGLDTDLTGSLRLAQSERNLATTGRIDLQSGTFNAYGQQLTIDNGTLIFTGNLTNPMLDIDAYRDSTDKRVRVTVNASGSALQPQLRISAQPDMPDSEALAYLLTGRGLSSADSEQGSAISNAALQSGIADPLLGEMRSSLGLDEFGFTSDAGGSALGLGKQITPDIFLGYSVGLFDNLSQLLIRWRLTDKLELDSRSGEQQSVDLYYRIERD